MSRMPKDMQAFNVTLLNLTPPRVALMRPVTSLDALEGNTQNFHPDGLFSIEIFGRIGSDQRNKQFSYIDINIPILHPFIVEMLTKIKGLYNGILMGRSFAKWNESIKDFEQSDELNGQTGYDFFMQYFPKINFEPKGMRIRDVRMKLIHDYRRVGQYDKILVIPAGLRDAEIDEHGQITENEINEHYRRLLGVANTIPKGATGPIYDRARASLQTAFNNLFNLYKDLIGGKDKMIQKRLNYRRIHNGTRNVIVAMDNSVSQLGDPNNIGINHTHIGLFQAAKGMLPVVCYNLRKGILDECFKYTGHGSAKLINPDTWKSEVVALAPAELSAWSTTEGMERFIDRFAVVSNRDKPVIINGYYPALVYLGEGTYRVFYDIGDLPEHLHRDDVRPITNTELLFLSLGHRWKEYIVTVTRYPIAGDGSVYPSIPYIKTTTIADRRVPLDDNWQPIMDDDLVIPEYPRLRTGEIAYIDTMAPHTSRHAGLAAD